MWKFGFFCLLFYSLWQERTHLVSGAYTELGDLREEMEAKTLSAKGMRVRPGVDSLAE